ncbi:hypothetical protein D9M68_852620 [compost metagenome]
MRLRISDGNRLKGAVNHITYGQQKLFEHEWNIDEQLFFDLYQLVFIGKLQGHWYWLIRFTELFDHFFHGSLPLT